MTNDKTVASGEVRSTLLMVGVQPIKYTEHIAFNLGAASTSALFGVKDSIIKK